MPKPVATKEATATTACKYQSQEISQKKLSKSLRNFVLSRPGNRKLDGIYAQAYKPRGAFPPCKIVPSWRRWPLNQKLPQINVECWSRGGLGQSLLPPAALSTRMCYPSIKPDFILIDPSHVTLPYDPLHDPGLAKHFEKPTVKSVLRAKNSIDPQGFVRCSQKTQNAYRSYLHTTLGRNEAKSAFKLEVDKRLQICQERKAFDSQAQDWPAKWDRWNEILLRGKQVQEDKLSNLEYKLNSALQRRQRVEDEARAERAATELYRQDIEFEKELKRHETLGESAVKYLERYGVTIYSDPIPRADDILRKERAEKVKNDKKASKNAQKKARWESMLAARELRTLEKQWALEVTTVERQRHIAEREARNLEHQRRIPLLIERRKLRAKRRQELARKYGMIWLNKIREKLKRQKMDVTHFSSFEIYKSLDHTVGWIYFETGQAKHGTGLLGMDLKEFLKSVKEQINIDASQDENQNEEEVGGDQDQTEDEKLAGDEIEDELDEDLVGDKIENEGEKVVEDE